MIIALRTSSEPQKKTASDPHSNTKRASGPYTGRYKRATRLIIISFSCAISSGLTRSGGTLTLSKTNVIFPDWLFWTNVWTSLGMFANSAAPPHSSNSCNGRCYIAKLGFTRRNLIRCTCKYMYYVLCTQCLPRGGQGEQSTWQIHVLNAFHCGCIANG